MLAFIMHKILPTNSLKESCGGTFRLAYSSVHKILEKLRVPSLVDMYVEMRACERSCGILHDLVRIETSLLNLRITLN